MRALRLFRVRDVAVMSFSPCHTSRATFYDKIKDERDKSENDVEAMFSEFPKSSHAQKVPDELHQVSRKVIDRAEYLNYIFLVCTAIGAVFVGYLIDPFRSDTNSRPDRSMAAQTATKYGNGAAR